MPDSIRSSLDLSKTRVIVVDDSRVDRLVAEAALKTLGCRFVQSAPDGVAGISMLENAESAGIPFDLVLLDWEMPKSNGLRLLRDIRKSPQLRHLPVILMTASAEAVRVEEAIENQVSEILIKPLTEATLAAKIARVLNPA